MTIQRLREKLVRIVKMGAKKLTSGVPEKPPLVCEELIMKVLINNWCMFFYYNKVIYLVILVLLLIYRAGVGNLFLVAGQNQTQQDLGRP